MNTSLEAYKVVYPDVTSIANDDFDVVAGHHLFVSKFLKKI